MKAKSLLQLIILLQAAAIAGFLLSLATPFSQSLTSEWTFVHMGILRGGNGTAGLAAVFLGALPGILWRSAVALSVFWWLKQQRAAVVLLDPDHPMLSRRAASIAVAFVSILCLVGFAALRHSAEPEPSRDLVNSPTPHSVPLDELEKEQPRQ